MPRNLELAQEAVSNLFKAYSLDGDLVFGEIVPLTKIEQNLVYDYTGLVGLSGKFKGGICITCKSEFLNFLYKKLTNQNPETPIKKVFSDLIGEMANTIAGYFQKEYGDQFLISVPYVIIGSAEVGFLERKIFESSQSFSMPFYHNGIESILVLSFSPVAN